MGPTTSSTLPLRTVTHLLCCSQLTLLGRPPPMHCCPPLCVPGVHSVQVLYDDTPVPKSPFRVSVSEGCDPSRVVATGPGLQQALTDKPNSFSIITRYSSEQRQAPFE